MLNLTLRLAPKFRFCVFKGFRHVVDILVCLVIIGLHRGRGRVERSVLDLWLAAETVEQLPEAGEQPGPVGPDLAILLAQPELHGEPVDCGQLLDLLVRGAEAGQTYLLTELGKPRVSKQWCMPDELMEYVPVTSD